jgi:hypothetical protein
MTPPPKFINKQFLRASAPNKASQTKDVDSRVLKRSPAGRVIIWGTRNESKIGSSKGNHSRLQFSSVRINI